MWPFAWKLHKRKGLRFWILSLLDKSPKNGAEIMDAIEERSQGWWRPSPGSIYPLLESLEQEGLVKKRTDGRYELTEKSKEEIEWPSGMHGHGAHGIEGMLNEMKGYVAYFEDLRKSDRPKLDPHKREIRKVAERLSALVGEGGEKD